jgi:hypothetical protein
MPEDEAKMGGQGGGPKSHPRQQEVRELNLPERETEDERLLQRDEVEEAEFLHTDPWRVFRIMGEFVEGFDTLADLGPAVTSSAAPACRRTTRGTGRPRRRAGVSWKRGSP